MILFNLKTENRLSQINEVYFDLEKDIQKIGENNIQSLFRLELVASEFSLDGLRVDTSLAQIRIYIKETVNVAISMLNSKLKKCY